MDETTPVWKKIYHTICQNNKSITPEMVHDVLKMSKKKLLNVFLEFKPYTRKSYVVWLKETKIFSGTEDEDMRNFIDRLSRELDLDVSMSWMIICNYLMFEYYGKVDELKSIIRFESNVKCLIDNIWHFYTADRMFLLKIIRHIFEKCFDENYRYYKEYKHFIKSINHKAFWDNLLQVFDGLVLEITNDKVKKLYHNNIERWVKRNSREQCEVLLLMTHTLHYLQISGEEMSEILTRIVKHGSSRQPLYSKSNILADPVDVKQIRCANIGLVLMIAYKYLQTPNVCKPIPKIMENSLEVTQTNTDFTVILFIWAVVKAKITHDSLDYCNQVVCFLTEKKVFLLFYDVLSNEIFMKCKSGYLVYQATSELFCEFAQICSDNKYCYEQEGISDCAALLMKHKSLNSHANLQPLLKFAIESFPYDFKSLTNMCCELLQFDEYYFEILNVIENLPGYLSNTPWIYQRGPYEIELDSAFHLYSNSNLFIIPRKTIIKKYTIFDTDLTRYHYVFSYYTLLEQNLLNLMSSYDETLVKNIVLGYGLIKTIIKYYKGDFSKDTPLRNCIKKLNCILAHFADGNQKNFDLVKLYFSLQVELIVYNRASFQEVFSLVLQKKFLPHLATPEFSFRQLFTGEVQITGLLYEWLKEEEKSEDHSLLLDYIKFLDVMLERDIYHDEVQRTALAYLTYAVFPHYQQWRYKDPHQMVLICKGCFTSYVKLLQNPPDLNNKTFMQYLKTFLKEEWFLSVFISTFVRDKFYMATLMENESNWLQGPVCDVIETFRMQLVLLLLLIKHKTKLELKEKVLLDDQISVISKGISCQMVNGYSNALVILSLKFLDVLAKDQNAPLMALLGLDYDQAQRVFLDRLRDPLEDDDVKFYILDLIGTCVIYQHGMTAAFFNLNCSRKWYDNIKHKIPFGDTVSDFMVDYLQNIKKSRQYLRNPLQLSILKVMCNLWKCKKQTLIQDVINLSAFWPLLADPLFHEFDQHSLVYAYIIKIFTIQIFYKPLNYDKHFGKVLQNFFQNKKQIQALIDYVLQACEKLANEDSRKATAVDMSYLLNTLTEFLVVVQQKCPQFLQDQDTQYMFVTMALDGIQLRNQKVEILCDWYDYCFIVFTNWNINFPGNEKEFVKKLTSTWGTITAHYEQLSFRSRDSILSSTKKVLEDLKGFFEEHSAELVEFLELVGVFVDYEYETLEEIVWHKVAANPYDNQEYLIPWMVTIHTINNLLQFRNVIDCAVWFKYRNHVNRLIKFIPNVLTRKQTLVFGKVAIYGLTLLLQSPLGFDIISIDLVKFFDSVEPALSAHLAEQNIRNHPSFVKDVLINITMTMRFAQASVNKYHLMALKSCFGFLTINERIINFIVSSLEYTVDFHSLDLVTSYLMFVDDLLLHANTEWYCRANETYKATLKDIRKIINACISVILRPKNISFYEVDEYERFIQLDKVPATVMALVMNKLINIIGIAFNCLYKYNPDLVSMMDVYVPTDIYYMLIQSDFSVPKFELPIPVELTYGRLLCLAHFLCKTLSQLQQSPSKADLKCDDNIIRYIGMVDRCNTSEYLPNQKLSAFLRCAMYEYSGLSDPWIAELDVRTVQNALEMLMTFLAAHIFLTIKTMEPSTLAYYKRNLCSELQFFYEYIKKRLVEMLTTPMREEPVFKTEVDIFKRFMISMKINHQTEKIVEEHFLIVIAQWFTNFCNLN